MEFRGIRGICRVNKPLCGLFMRLSKNYASVVDIRGAGEREGARPASRYNNPPQKSLIFQAFWAKQRFE